MSKYIKITYPFGCPIHHDYTILLVHRKCLSDYFFNCIVVAFIAKTYLYTYRYGYCIINVHSVSQPKSIWHRDLFVVDWIGRDRYLHMCMSLYTVVSLFSNPCDVSHKPGSSIHIYIFLQHQHPADRLNPGWSWLGILVQSIRVALDMCEVYASVDLLQVQ